MGERPLFQQVLQLLPVQRVVQHGREAGAHLGLIAVTDRLDEQIAQGLALELQLAEHVEDLAAEGLAGLLQLLQQPAVDVAFAGLLGHQVPQVADLGLADAVDAAEALLDAVGVPRQIVVHHQVGTLQVDALARRVGGQQHLHLGIVPERLLRLHALFAAHAAVDHDHGLGAAQQRGDAVLQIGERVAVLGEEHQLLPGRGHRFGDGADRVGGPFFGQAVADGGGREDLAEQAGQLAPLGVRAAAPDAEGQRFQAASASRSRPSTRRWCARPWPGRGSPPRRPRLRSRALPQGLRHHRRRAQACPAAMAPAAAPRCSSSSSRSRFSSRSWRRRSDW